MTLRFFYCCFFMIALSACTEEKSATAPAMSSAEAEAILHERFDKLTDRSSQNGLPAYDPLIALEGSQPWQPLPRANDAEKTIPERAIREIEDYARRTHSSTLMVWRNGLVEAERYFGETTADTEIVSKSLSKPISVIAVGRAIAEGHIDSLDQPMADFIHEWRGTSKEKMRIRDLLGMRSGLLPQAQVESADDVLMRAYLHPFFEDVLINEYPLVNEPGTRYDYSNATADLVAPLIERATGVEYEDWLTNEVLKPIGARGGQIWMGRLGGMPHAGCCALLPAEVYLRTAILVLQDGVWDGQRLLPEGFVSEISTATKENPHAGMGLYIGSPYIEGRGAANPDVPYGKTFHSEPYLADDLVLFDGNSNQVAYIVPSENLVILRTGSWAPSEPKWDNAFIPNTILRSINTPDQAENTPPRFSDGMQMHKPLGLVRGNKINAEQDRSDVFITADENPDFSEAIQYAAAMGSYGLIIWQGGKLLLEEYFEDFDSELRPDTASMHKSVLALIMAAAIEDGFIDSADDPIGKYIAQWQDQPEGEITIRQLMTMSSGLKPLSSEGGMDSPRMKFFTNEGNARQIILGLKLEVEPDSRYQYANTNSQLLGLIVESATGLPYEQYLSKRLWQRIGADDA